MIQSVKKRFLLVSMSLLSVLAILASSAVGAVEVRMQEPAEAIYISHAEHCHLASSCEVTAGMSAAAALPQTASPALGADLLLVPLAVQNAFLTDHVLLVPNPPPIA